MLEIRQTIFEGVEVLYSDLYEIIQVNVDGIDSRVIFGGFNESNYNCVQAIGIPVGFDKFCFRLFDTTKELKSQGNHELATNLSNYFFESFTPLWSYYLLHERHLLATSLWQIVCSMTWKWEKKNNFKIHKGTPYFFLGSTQLMQGNIDSAFLFIYNAMEEDKRLDNGIGDKNHYKKLPAYLFSSLVADDPRNYLYPYVIDGKKQIDMFIDEFNKLFPKRIKFSYKDFDEKLLKNEELEDTKYFFVYSLFCIINQLKHYEIKDLVDNDFSRLRNADMIFNLCLIADEIMKNKTQERYTGGSVMKICKDKFGEPRAEDIHRYFDFENHFEEAVKNCLSFTYPPKPNLKKEVLILILVWGLRNFGGHNIKAQKILSDRYPDIMQYLMNAIFIILNEMY